MKNAFLLIMMSVPLLRIERRLHPHAAPEPIGTMLCAPDLQAPWENLAQSHSQEDKSSDALAVPCINAACPLGTEEARSEMESTYLVPFAGAGIPFSERPGERRLSAPSSLRIGESCAASDREYREIYGPTGSIQRCKEQFIASGFTPRKTLHPDRSERPLLDFGRTALDPANVCLIPFSRTSHAA